MSNSKSAIAKRKLTKPFSKGSIEQRIATVQLTIVELVNSPPALGGKWRSGMLEYYRRVLKELKAYATTDSQAK